jgi:sugar phosphate isomerase/epimerase
MRIIAEAGRGNAVLCLDPVNFVRGGGTPAQIRETGARWFPYAQIADGIVNPGEPDPAKLGRMPHNERALLGAGMIDLYAILDALPAGIPLSVEIPQELSAGLPGQDGRAMAPTEWASFLARHTRDFVNGYYAARR